MAKLDDEDLKAIKILVEVTFDEKLDETLDTKLSHLPTKDEFYEQTAKILKKLDDLEIDHEILADRVSKHEDRIQNIETQLRPQAD